MYQLFSRHKLSGSLLSHKLLLYQRLHHAIFRYVSAAFSTSVLYLGSALTEGKRTIQIIRLRALLILRYILFYILHVINLQQYRFYAIAKFVGILLADFFHAY